MCCRPVTCTIHMFSFVCSGRGVTVTGGRAAADEAKKRKKESENHVVIEEGAEERKMAAHHPDPPPPCDSCSRPVAVHIFGFAGDILVAE